ncbi:MAG TPA: branched-chain amino acid ABC transporter substrate-binding protein [Burkholderiales bacterium]|jgi:branched-chain amino acid transport system substrate-binding protein|nr:branched-chain amino acid ABC transporter substrate-binding protein [Burkholderiales bacterium]
MKRTFVFLAAILGFAAVARAADTIKIAHIDPQSGPFALQGQSGSRHIQKAIDEINARGGVLGGVKLELVTFDNKSSPQDSLIALKQATDQGIRYVTQGNGSHVAHALTEAVLKYNQRNPGKEILYLNHAAIDPALTNDKCNFWHFRFDANVDMKIDALTSAIAARKEIRKVYLINQDYAYGQSVQRVSREMLAKKRPDIQIVGDELHPIGKVKDFAPYVAKIKASGADTVLTGNWGNDLALLIKAAEDAGLKANFYTNYAYLVGTPRAFGASGAERVKTVASWAPNLPGYPLEKYYLDYKNRYKEDWGFIPIKYAIDMWALAIDKAGSADPLKVARALEGLRYDGGAGEVWMRPDDHQLMEPLFVSTFTKAGRQGVKYDADDTGYGWKTEVRIDAKDNILPTTCKMERP